MQLEAKATAYTLEAGIIFHSIFIGITLGSTAGAATVRSLMIALMFHQGNEVRFARCASLTLGSAGHIDIRTYRLGRRGRYCTSPSHPCRTSCSPWHALGCAYCEVHSFTAPRRLQARCQVYQERHIADCQDFSLDPAF